MLNRIVIKGYKSLQDVDVTLQPLSVLFGPNATGKSNFLDALQLLSRLATSRTLNEAFAPPHRGKPLESFTFGAGGLEALREETKVSLSLQADVELSSTVVQAVDCMVREIKSEPTRSSNGHGASAIRETRLRYRIVVEMLPGAGILRVADEFVTALSGQGQPVTNRRPFLERAGQRLQLRREGQAQVMQHARHLDHSVLSLPLYPPHHPHLVALRQELSSWAFFYLEPRERMRAPTPFQQVNQIGPMGENLAGYLHTLKGRGERQFDNLERSLHLLIPSMTGVAVGLNNLGEVELGVRENGRVIPSCFLSEGTLRLLGMLALVGQKAPPALVGLEEPETGIHPARLGLIAEYLKTRQLIGDSQFIVTTHSLPLLDCLPLAALYACRRSEGQTIVEPFLLTREGKAAVAESATLDEADQEPTPVSTRVLRSQWHA
jgi:predicted ATPase